MFVALRIEEVLRTGQSQPAEKCPRDCVDEM